jgi:hypothetical protein
MITLPPGFDVSLLFSDFYTVAAPFVSIAALIGCGFLLVNILTNIRY